MKVCIWAEKVDKIVFKFMYFVSVLAGISLIIAALLCTVDTLSARIFSYSLPNGTDWVTYLNIPIVFLAMGFIQVERGNTVVDLLSSKFPETLEKVVQIFGSVIGVCISLFLAYCEFTLTISKLSTGAKSSSAGNAFVVWPFALIIAIGYLLVGISFLWGIFRIILIAPERRMGAFIPEAGMEGEISAESNGEISVDSSKMKQTDKKASVNAAETVQTEKQKKKGGKRT
jgi:TRAP-type mannitol/chloroaromatic compound transport system permease small subunit